MICVHFKLSSTSQNTGTDGLDIPYFLLMPFFKNIVKEKCSTYSKIYIQATTSKEYNIQRNDFQLPSLQNAYLFSTDLTRNFMIYCM